MAVASDLRPYLLTSRLYWSLVAFTLDGVWALVVNVSARMLLL
jgi:hypothetical protein